MPPALPGGSELPVFRVGSDPFLGRGWSANCACKDTPPKLHGLYYRWTGFIQGKCTTKTISPPEARECQKRIRNYRALQNQINQLLRQALQHAPWNERPPTQP